MDQDAGQTHTFVAADQRFEVVGTKLKLKADQFLDRGVGGTVSVDVSVTDSGVPPQMFTQTLVLNVAANSRPWQNPVSFLNVDDNMPASVDLFDALLVINVLNDPGKVLDTAGRLPYSRPDGMPYLDTNGDGYCAPLDALLVINFLNHVPGTEGEFTLGTRASEPFLATTIRLATEWEDLDQLHNPIPQPFLMAVDEVPGIAVGFPATRTDSSHWVHDLDDVLTDIAWDISLDWAKRP